MILDLLKHWRSKINLAYLKEHYFQLKITKGEIMLKQQDRFVNNELLGFISRPQYEASCSMSSLTAVINYLFADQIGIKTNKEWAEDIKAPDPEEPGHKRSDYPALHQTPAITIAIF